MEPEYFIRHQELCKDEINVKKGWKNYLKKLNKLKNKTFNLSHLLFYLPACRRLLFPLLHDVPFPRAAKEIGDVCAQAIVLLAYSSL